jgi:predicted transposase/invertase (TIGR01784 family)
MEDIDNRSISVTNYYLFERIFGDENKTRPFCSLVGAVLNEDIWHVRILNSRVSRITFTKKGVVLDVRAIINKNRHLNVEMQVKHQSFFTQRTQFLLSRLHSFQLEMGKKYDELQEFVAINILAKGDYKFPNERWFHSYSFRHDEFHTPLPNGISRIFFIELEKSAKHGVANVTVKAKNKSNQLVQRGFITVPL